MVTLVCAVVGVGSVFSVNIELSEIVDGLKDKIKEKKPGLIYFDADLLKLYLAREGDTWLNSRDEDIKALKRREIPDRIKSLMQEELLLNETRDLDNDEYFGKTFERVEEDIHVLVECPDEPEQVNKYRRQDGFDGSLTENWFSWHLAWSSLRSLFTVGKEKQA